PEKPQRSVYYPFAVFSPEWQAIQFGISRNVPVRFMDLPQSIQMAMQAEAEAKAEAEAETDDDSEGDDASDAAETVASAPGVPPVTDESTPEAAAAEILASLNLDPLSHLARAAGYSDSERWWEHMVEHRHDGKDSFVAVLEAMTALREAAIQSSLQQLEPEREARREAHMRQTIRGAQKDGFKRIAVVCGAWHAPVLANMPEPSA